MFICLGLTVLLYAKGIVLSAGSRAFASLLLFYVLATVATYVSALGVPESQKSVAEPVDLFTQFWAGHGDHLEHSGSGWTGHRDGWAWDSCSGVHLIPFGALARQASNRDSGKCSISIRNVSPVNNYATHKLRIAVSRGVRGRLRW